MQILGENVTLNSVRREIVSALTIVSYDKVREIVSALTIVSYDKVREIVSALTIVSYDKVREIVSALIIVSYDKVREIVSALTIVSYDKVRGWNTARSVCVRFFITNITQPDTISQDTMMSYKNKQKICRVSYNKQLIRRTLK